LRVVDLRVPEPLLPPVDPDAPAERLAPLERLEEAFDRVDPEPLLVLRELPVEPDLLLPEPERALLPELRDDEPAERDPLDFLAPPEDERPELLVELRAPELRAPELDEPELDEPPSSSLHLPDMTRCAASATASAINEPRRVALDTTELAALVALSAASRPASRILRRAAGLALIAAAAAARPAASISRLIAALASLSTVLSSLREDDPRDDDLREEVVLPCLAIAGLPLSRRKTLQSRNGSQMSGLVRGKWAAT
jgi:hypothetical protein